jgi:hypothetical protein
MLLTAYNKLVLSEDCFCLVSGLMFEYIPEIEAESIYILLTDLAGKCQTGSIK